jgi:hypothetical protein
MLEVPKLKGRDRDVVVLADPQEVQSGRFFSTQNAFAPVFLNPRAFAFQPLRPLEQPMFMASSLSHRMRVTPLMIHAARA